jgi:hypothetical protein
MRNWGFPWHEVTRKGSFEVGREESEDSSPDDARE